MEKIARFVTSKPKLIILVSFLLLIPALLGYIFTDVNYDILTYLPDRLDSVKGENILSENYNIGSVTMVLVDNMQPKNVVKLKAKISDVRNVETVLWADDFIDTSIPSTIIPDTFKNVFYSDNGEHTVMFVQFSQDCSSGEIMKTVKEIKKVTAGQCLLSGLTPINVDTQEITNKELPIYLILAVILIIAVMLLTTESYILPFVIITVLGMSVLYNMGTNFLPGGISYITQCIAAILQLAVTMDYSIFLVNRYNEEKSSSESNQDAMIKALRASVTSLTGSSITTIFGFLALCFMQLKLGFNIGFVMAKGVALGVITVIVVLPAFLLVFDKYINAYKHKTFIPDFSKIIDFVLKHKKAFSVSFIVILVPAIILSANVKKYYNLNSTLPQDLDSIVALNTLKNEFNMTTTHFIVVDDNTSAEKLLEMENRIQNVEGINNLLAYNMFVGSTIPDSVVPDEITDLIKQGGYQVMLANSVFDAGTEESNKQVEEMYSIVKEYDPEACITGEGAMYDDLIGITKIDFTVTNIISILAIFVLIALLFKSYSVPIILIGSIELAIVINQGISTIFGQTIPFVAPTMISCVQLGATVDYAILLTSRFKEEIGAGLDKLSAIRKAAGYAMHSVFQSALIFFLVTSSVYIVSSLSIVKSLCAMLARGSVISALVILFILTPVLLLSENIIARTTGEWGLSAKHSYADKSVHFRKSKAVKTRADKVEKENDSINFMSDDTVDNTLSTESEIEILVSDNIENEDSYTEFSFTDEDE